MTHTAPEATHEDQDLVRTAAAHLYDAECALHNAHQAHVDAWITAANQKLHEAVSAYLDAAERCHAEPITS